MNNYLVTTTLGAFEVKAERFILGDLGVSFVIDETGVIAFVSYSTLSSIVIKENE